MKTGNEKDQKGVISKAHTFWFPIIFLQLCFGHSELSNKKPISGEPSYNYDEKLMNFASLDKVRLFVVLRWTFGNVLCDLLNWKYNWHPFNFINTQQLHKNIQLKFNKILQKCILSNKSSVWKHNNKQIILFN